MRARRAPKLLRHEGLDLAAAAHDKPEGRRLARPVREQPQAGQAELAPCRVTQCAREEPREGDAHLEVELLPCVHRGCLCRTRLAHVRQRMAHFAVCDRRECRAPDALGRKLPQDIQHLETDALTLAVTIQPQCQPAAALRCALQVGYDSEAL